MDFGDDIGMKMTEKSCLAQRKVFTFWIQHWVTNIRL